MLYLCPERKGDGNRKKVPFFSTALRLVVDTEVLVWGAPCALLTEARQSSAP